MGKEERYCETCGKKLSRWTTGVEEIERKWYCSKCGKAERNRIAAEEKRAGELRAKEREADRELLLSGLRQGKTPTEVIVGESPIFLKRQEELRVVLPSISLLEPRVVREFGAFYGGPTIRVAKGVSFRLGGAKG